VLRKCYHRHIEEGRLPRGSRAALALLNSIDVGLEQSNTDGLQDWDAVQRALDSIRRARGWVAFVQSTMVGSGWVNPRTRAGGRFALRVRNPRRGVSALGCSY